MTSPKSALAMDIDGAKLSSLSHSSSPAPKAGNKKDVPARKRYRRCRSAPGHVPRPDMIGGPASFLASDSNYWKPHPNFRNVAIILCMYLGLGTLCFYLVRGQIKGKKTNGALDAVYFCIVTMTTVGYGDLVPDTVLTKLLACAFVFSGMALVGLLLSKAADYLVEKQERLLVKALNKGNKVGPIDMQKKIENNRVRHKSYLAVTILFVLIFVGTIFLVVVEEFSFVDAFYCVCSTITTLGYGDKSFSTAGGRIFAVFWILTSTLCLGQIYLYVAEYNTEKRQKELVKWVLTRRMTDVDLEAADIDDDGEVGATDFVIYKLKEMGKISEEDIALVMKEFDELDVDQSGTISAADLRLSQTEPEKCQSHL